VADGALGTRSLIFRFGKEGVIREVLGRITISMTGMQSWDRSRGSYLNAVGAGLARAQAQVQAQAQARALVRARVGARVWPWACAFVRVAEGVSTSAEDLAVYCLLEIEFGQSGAVRTLA